MESKILKNIDIADTCFIFLNYYDRMCNPSRYEKVICCKVGQLYIFCFCFVANSAHAACESQIRART